MQNDWVPLSSSALVIGAMSLVLGAAMNPAEAGSTATQTLRVATDESTRWLAMAVMYTLASVTIVLGLPAVLSLVQERGHRLGLVGACIFCVGAIGTCSYAMLLVFFRAMVVAGAVRGQGLDRVTNDPGLVVFLSGWIGCFYLGVLLLAAALLRARTTPRWVPVLLGMFLVTAPVAPDLGRFGATVHVMLLAVACTGAAMAAVSRGQRALVPAKPAY
ncbi:MAG TPA: hypothetical protein VER39_04690 [Nocardioidaceae bacterium]|nr:hypothetical protein [Nocardioidaceae bacterium]